MWAIYTILVLVVSWSIMGVIFLTFLVKETKNSSYVLSKAKRQWVELRDGGMCQFSEWDISSKSFKACGEAFSSLTQVGISAEKSSSYVCTCQKHANWLAKTDKVTSNNLILAAKEREKILTKLYSYPAD